MLSTDAAQRADEPLMGQGSSGRKTKKFAITCMSVVVVLLALGVIGFFVGGPILAKKAMGDSVISFDAMNMVCSEKNQSIVVASTITLSNIGPMGATIHAMEMTLMYQDHPFATLQMPEMIVEAGVDNHRSLPYSPLKVTDKSVWGNASAAMLQTDKVAWRLKGEASLTSKVMGISATFHNVPIDKTVTFKGFNSFKNLMKVTSLDVIGGSSDALIMSVDTDVTNPSNIAASMGSLSLEMWVHGESGDVKIGHMHIDDFNLAANAHGNAKTTMKNVKAWATLYDPSDPNYNTARKFLSNFNVGKDQKIFVVGSSASTNITLMQRSLVGFRSDSVVPGLPQHRFIFKSVLPWPDLWHIGRGVLPTSLSLQNPFTADVHVLGSHCDIYPCLRLSKRRNKCKEFSNASMGIYTEQPMSALLPSKGSAIVDEYETKLHSLFDFQALKEAWEAGGKGDFIRVVGSMKLQIGEGVFTIDYEETEIPLCLKFGGHDCDNNASFKGSDTATVVV
jgi:hypothetical protein